MFWKRIELTDTEYLIVPKSPDDFTVILGGDDDEIVVHLGIYIEQLDMREFDKRWDNIKHHICPRTYITVINPLNNDMLQNAIESMGLDKIPGDPYFKAWIAQKYAGGIPIPTTRIFDIMRDNGIDVPYLAEGECFKCWEDADKFTDAVMEIAPLMSTLIGFYLDTPINSIGNTGWDIIRLYVENYDYIGDSLRI